MKTRIILSSMLFAAGISMFSVEVVAKNSARVDSLLRVMTFDEKIGQLNQLSGQGYSSRMVSEIKSGRVGSLLNEADPDIINGLQRVAVDSTRLHIPLVFARDVIHGFKTIFPIPLGQAATWDADIVRRGAAIAADEASSVGVRWTFSPMVDIARDARWGRIAEGFGEDPYLVSKLGVAMVEGYQGDDLSKPNTMAACTKHFACYGAGEAGLDYNSSWLAEQTLYDVYLPPFEACAKAGSATFMASFNEINGIPSHANETLLRDLLRNRWNWQGMVVSDWNGVGQLVSQGYSADLKQAAEHALNSGVSMDMEGHGYLPYLRQLVEEGKVSMTTIDSLVAEVLTLKERLGLFDNPYVDEKNSRRFCSKESLEAARDAAARSAVLLKNSGILPLKAKPGKVAVSGPMCDAQHDQNGTWCFDLEKERTVTPLTSLREEYGDKNVIDARGLEYSRDKEASHIDRAVAAARNADVILYFAGEEAILSGEAHCRTDLRLPGAQADEIAALKATGKPVVLVIMAGRPLEITAQNDIADAIIYYFHPGTMGGPAIADVLSGRVNPQGRLPICLPRSSNTMPLYYARTNTARPPVNAMMIDEIPLEAGQTSTGCTSYYLDSAPGPLYTFGYGLSYTDFKYGDVRISSSTIPAGGAITASCTVTNTGRVVGTETVQLYIRDLVGSLVRPVRELKGFEKITLKPGESREVAFTISTDILRFHNRKMDYVAEPGEFNVWIAPDSQSGRPATFRLK